jgi:hypothetical protein
VCVGKGRLHVKMVLSINNMKYLRNGCLNSSNVLLSSLTPDCEMTSAGCSVEKNGTDAGSLFPTGMSTIYEYL